MEVHFSSVALTSCAEKRKKMLSGFSCVPPRTEYPMVNSAKRSYCKGMARHFSSYSGLPALKLVLLQLGLFAWLDGNEAQRTTDLPCLQSSGR